MFVGLIIISLEGFEQKKSLAHNPLAKQRYILLDVYTSVLLQTFSLVLLIKHIIPAPKYSSEVQYFYV